MPPASTIMERTPPMKRTLLATIKERVMRTHGVVVHRGWTALDG